MISTLPGTVVLAGVGKGVALAAVDGIVGRAVTVGVGVTEGEGPSIFLKVPTQPAFISDTAIMRIAINMRILLFLTSIIYHFRPFNINLSIANSPYVVCT
jgi:hypothetical protein